MPTVKAIKSRAKFNALRDSDKLFFIEFYADWCEQCRITSPEFERIASENAREGEVEFYKLNIDGAADGLAASLGIESTPWFYAYKGNRLIGEVKGADRINLRSLVDRLLTELQTSQSEPFRWFSTGRLR